MKAPLNTWWYHKAQERLDETESLVQMRENLCSKAEALRADGQPDLADAFEADALAVQARLNKAR